MSFNAILTAFQQFFSRSFWFGSFLPVAVFAGLHLLIAAVQFPDAVSGWVNFSDLGGEIAALPVAAILLILVAYVAAPFAPALRSLLDGTVMPAWLHNRLRPGRIKQARQARAAQKSARSEARRRQLFCSEQIKRFQVARKAGIDKNAITDRESIERAAARVGSLEAELSAGQLPEESRVRSACNRVADALERNSARLAEGNPDQERSQRLNVVHEKMVEVLRDCATEAEHLRHLLYARNAKQSLSMPQATSIGDARLLAERYTNQVYNVDFDYVWPRLQLVLKKDEEFYERLNDAQSQLNFAALSLALSATLLLWLPLLAFTASSPWLFLVIGGATPFAMKFLYHLVVESQIAFGEVVKMAVDRYRFDVLKALHQPLPATLFEERDLWDRLQKAEVSGRTFDLVYRRREAQG